MSIRVARASGSEVQAVVGELREELGEGDWQVVLYFASSSYPQEEMASALHSAFAPARTVGCSTAGELVSGEVAKGAVVVMGIQAGFLHDHDARLVEGIQDPGSVEKALDELEGHFGAELRELPVEEYVGLVLMDGLSGAEEQVMDTVGNRSDLFFVGGSAGDDLAFSRTHVHLDGEAHTDAAVLMVLKPSRGFEIIKTQSFRALETTLRATSVDEATRTVLTFNDQPAAEAYAGAIGVPVEEISEHFMSHPVGLMVGEEPFVRSPQQVQDGTIRFYCAVKEGMELQLLESTNIVQDTARTLNARIGEGQTASGLLNFNCILRTLELERNQDTEAYGQVFADLPTAGFSTYGEAFLGHINQTATMLLFR